MNTENKKLFVSNLPKNHDEEKLHYKVSLLFSSVGPLETVALFKQTRSPLVGQLTGTALVEFKKAEHAEKAIYLYDKDDILGCRIGVKFYRNREVDSRLPCEFCNELFTSELLLNHQVCI